MPRHRGAKGLISNYKMPSGITKKNILECIIEQHFKNLQFTSATKTQCTINRWMLHGIQPDMVRILRIWMQHQFDRSNPMLILTRHDAPAPRSVVRQPIDHRRKADLLWKNEQIVNHAGITRIAPIILPHMLICIQARPLIFRNEAYPPRKSLRKGYIN